MGAQDGRADENQPCQGTSTLCTSQPGVSAPRLAGLGAPAVLLASATTHPLWK